MVEKEDVWMVRLDSYTQLIKIDCSTNRSKTLAREQSKGFRLVADKHRFSLQRGGSGASSEPHLYLHADTGMQRKTHLSLSRENRNGACGP